MSDEKKPRSGGSRFHMDQQARQRLEELHGELAAQQNRLDVMEASIGEVPEGEPPLATQVINLREFVGNERERLDKMVREHQWLCRKLGVTLPE